MVRHRCISLDSPSEWRDALLGIKHSIAHTWEYCRAIHLSSGLSTYLYCFEDRKTRIACPIAERTLFASIDILTPYGLSGFTGSSDRPEFSGQWVDFARQRGYICGYIVLNPLFANASYCTADDLHHVNSIYVMDLALDEEDLLACLSKGRRWELMSWRKKGTEVILDKPSLTQFFVTNYREFMQEKDAAPVYFLSNDSLAALCGLDNVLLVGVGGAGGVEAVSVFGYTSHGADYLFNVSSGDGRRHSAALIWEGMKLLKAKSVPALNLGGGVRENDGLAQFKRRFGGKRLALRCLKQVYQPQRYRELCGRANVDPADRSGYFPAYRRPKGIAEPLAAAVVEA